MDSTLHNNLLFITSTFLQIPLALIMVIAMNRTPLVLAISFPLLGRIRNFHPLVTCAARRTKNRGCHKTYDSLCFSISFTSFLLFPLKDLLNISNFIFVKKTVLRRIKFLWIHSSLIPGFPIKVICNPPGHKPSAMAGIYLILGKLQFRRGIA